MFGKLREATSVDGFETLFGRLPLGAALVSNVGTGDVRMMIITGDWLESPAKAAGALSDEEGFISLEKRSFNCRSG